MYCPIVIGPAAEFGEVWGGRTEDLGEMPSSSWNSGRFFSAAMSHGVRK
jgi:hypothetical protein